MQLVEFAKAGDDWLCCNGVMEAELDHLDGLVRKMKGKEIAGGGFDTDVFLLAKGVDSVLQFR
jgi:hypothetical protein